MVDFLKSMNDALVLEFPSSLLPQASKIKIKCSYSNFQKIKYEKLVEIESGYEETVIAKLSNSANRNIFSTEVNYFPVEVKTYKCQASGKEPAETDETFNVTITFSPPLLSPPTSNKTVLSMIAD
jgi:hypothetical protein